MEGTQKIALLSEIHLEPGSLADWLSAIMSGLAVFIAAASFGITAYLQRRADRRTDRDTARVVGVKLLVLFDSVKSLERHFFDHLRYSVTSRRPDNLSANRIPPLVGTLDNRAGDFDQREIALILSIGDADFLNNLVHLSSRHRGTLQSMEEYKLRYLALAEKMPPPVAVDGTICTSEFDRDQFRQIAPYLQMANQLITGIYESVCHEVAVVESLAERYSPLMQRHFKVGHWFEITLATVDNGLSRPLHRNQSLSDWTCSTWSRLAKLMKLRR